MEINGFENYLIYPSGKVYSKVSKRYLKPTLGNRGYFNVNLYKDGKEKKHQIHRLLALHFIENPDNKAFVDHIDQNKTNNKLNNLRWATDSENGQNRTFQKNNKVGIKNISYHKTYNIYVYKKTLRGLIHQKRFKTLEEAIEYKKNYEKNI